MSDDIQKQLVKKEEQLINEDGPDIYNEKEMQEYRGKFSSQEFSKYLKICKWETTARQIINNYTKAHAGKELSFMDVGGRHGEKLNFASGYRYNILEIDKSAKGPNLIYGDICSCGNIKNESYDVVFSSDVFEHIKEPWMAAEECVRITKAGGINIHVTLFSWRWHPVPTDTFRYTHSGMTHLFERTGKIKTIFAGYDLVRRRHNTMGGKMKDRVDAVPIDEMGGWRENWRVVFVGEKTV